MEEDPRDPRAKEGGDPLADPGGGSGDLEDLRTEGDERDGASERRGEYEDEPAP